MQLRFPRPCLFPTLMGLCLGLSLQAQAPTPSKAEAAPTTKKQAPKANPPATPAVRGKSSLKPVALNSATKNEIGFMLKIPEALAAKIVAGRPYKVKADLVTKGVLTLEQYKALKDKVAVH